MGGCRGAAHPKYCSAGEVVVLDLLKKSERCLKLRTLLFVLTQSETEGSSECVCRNTRINKGYKQGVYLALERRHANTATKT